MYVEIEGTRFALTIVKGALIVNNQIHPSLCDMKERVITVADDGTRQQLIQAVADAIIASCEHVRRSRLVPILPFSVE